MSYNLKIIESNNKIKQKQIEDLKELKKKLEEYQNELIEIELHKVKVFKKER